jgi:predicted aspartyl protease
LDGLLDTGSDETVFEEGLAAALGIDLSQAEERQVGLVGRTKPACCRYARVELQITDGRQEVFRWPAVVGFVATALRYSLLGHAGFLQFFDAEFRGAAQEVVLTPNASFPGTRV